MPLTEAILEMSRAGLGIAILAEWLSAPHLLRGDRVSRRLGSGPPQRTWSIAYRRQLEDPAVRYTPHKT
ncbi:LysR substrate-binding domain-containing protein [Corallococcus terminator]